MSESSWATTATLWSKHRVEALTDGIFAVAMTLLVIELKIPDAHLIRSQDDLLQSLADQIPQLMSWLISFFVLAIFWVSHHRLFHYVRVVDGGLLWRNIFQLAFVALMPFCAALLGDFAMMPAAQAIYNGNMIALGVINLLKVRYVRRHPALTVHPMESGAYHATLLRIAGLIVLAIAAIVVAQTPATAFATLVYLLMIPIGIYSRRVEARAWARAQARASAIAPPAPLPSGTP